MELNEAYFNAGFKKSDLFPPMLLKLDCDLLDDKGEAIGKGILTNWSMEGCFVRLEEQKNSRGIKAVLINFKDHEFKQQVDLASLSKDNLSCGFKFKNQISGRDSQDLGWSDFYEIIEEMGYSAERLA